jgi:hypothetical protein
MPLIVVPSRGETAVRKESTPTTDTCCCNIAVFRILVGTDRRLCPDRLLESVAPEVAELECGRSVDSISPRSFGRKSQVPGHQGKKPQWEFLRFFWSAKPEDALCDRQKFFGVNHRSLPCEARPCLPTGPRELINFTPLAALCNALCIKTGAPSTYRGAPYRDGHRSLCLTIGFFYSIPLFTARALQIRCGPPMKSRPVFFRSF